MDIHYQIESELINEGLIDEMSNLYSLHYGFWGKSSEKHGKRIELSPKKIREWTINKNTRIATARDSGKLVGYAIAVQAHKKKKARDDKNLITWVTQLVVHEDYRRHRIGKELLFSFWGFSNYFAWGIMSSNPYAIRALEKATYRRVNPKIIKKSELSLKEFGIENISYVDKNTEFVVTKDNSKVNTNFPADISKVDIKLQNVIKENTPWVLGDIEEGWEWFAFTFNYQEKILLTKDEINKMLDVSDKIAHKAYSKMEMDSPSQLWAKHTSKEVQFIVDNCKLERDSKIADFGCGFGRHTNELMKQGYTNTIGIDYSAELITKARQNTISPSCFIEGDCREINIDKKLDVVICLYDVIGSFIDNNENIRILECIYQNLKKDGYALISVMNFELTKHIAKNSFSLEREHNKLLELTASDTMQTTGNVFNPDYYMVDTDTNIVYRREQFSDSSDLPQELIVRDYRYTKDEIEEMCTEAGFEIVFSRFVQSGKWDIELEATNTKAKEILLLCKK